MVALIADIQCIIKLESSNDVVVKGLKIVKKNFSVGLVILSNNFIIPL